MGIISRQFLIIFILLLPHVLTSSAQTFSNYTFSTKQIFNSCKDLPVLNAHLYWNHIPSTRSIQIAYRATQTPGGWIAWAINPTGTGMVGSQAIVSFQHSNGSMAVYPTPITSYNPSMQPRSLSYQVSNISAEYDNGEMTIFAVVGPLDNKTTVNHVWQAGDIVSNNIPQTHPTSGPNTQSTGTVDFLAQDSD